MKSLLFGLVIIFPFTSNVMAEASYKIYFLNPDAHYSVTIKRPLGNAPNSECMHEWAQPASDTTLKPDGGSFDITITDKDAIGPCKGEAKYNTWAITATPIDGYKDTLRVKTGTLQFYHSEQRQSNGGYKWTTNMKTSGDAIVAEASCADGDKSNSKEMNCLNTYAVQQSGANKIYINFVTTDPHTCTDFPKDDYLINNTVLGIAPTWGGTNLNKFILGPIKSGQKGMAPGIFFFRDDLDTDIGKKVFKLASLAYNTSSTLQIKCDGNGGYESFMVTD